MLIWDDCKTVSQRLAQDGSTEAVTFLDMMMNFGYKQILQTLGRQVTEQQATSTLTADTRGYMVPPDALTPKVVTLLDGTNRWPLTEEPSDIFWEARRNSQQTGRPSHWHYRSRFGWGGGIIELDPIPSSSSYSIEMIYEATERDLSQTKYSTGSIGVTNGSNAVTGSGTTFTADMVGRYLLVKDSGAQKIYYRIGSFTSATSISLENNYHGLTDASTTYEIAEIFALPEDLHMLPVFYAQWQWWDSKGNAPRANKYQKQFEAGIETAKKTHANVTRDITIPGDTLGISIFGEQYPSNFPVGLAS